jgi:hypothetical protein
MTLPVRLATAALLAGTFAAAGAGAAQAAVPSVTATLYSPVVSGNIGAATSGASVTVKLLRAGSTVATSPVATTDAAGAWTATLPTHAPSDSRDVLEVDYAGSGAPAHDAQYRLSNDDQEELFWGFAESATVTGDGGSISIYCGTCSTSTIPVHVAYANGASEDFSTTGSTHGTSTAALTPAVGISDVVTYVGTLGVDDLGGAPTTLRLNARAGLPGQYLPARCTGDLAIGMVSCSYLPLGSYDVVRVRDGSPSLTATVAPTVGWLQTTFPSLRAGDQLELHEHGVPDAITTTHLVTVRRDARQTTITSPDFGYSLSPQTTGGDCVPGTWLMTFFVGGVCPPSGVVASGDFVGNQSSDDLSPGATVVTPPSFTATSPLDGENVYGPSVVAFADLGHDAAVAMSYGPLNGARQPASGNASSAAGAQVTGLVAGTRYNATWVATDANGDTTTLSSRFNDQTGSSAAAVPAPDPAPAPAGPAGAPGKQGVAGPAGKPGPRGARGPAGAGVRGVIVTCKHGGTKCKATVVLTSAKARVSMRLARGRTVYAIGSGVTRSRHTVFALRLRHPLKRERYAMTVVVNQLGHARTGVGTVRVR